MKRSRFTDELIIGFLKQVEAGAALKDRGRKHRVSDASFYMWRSRRPPSFSSRGDVGVS
jgi:putative transposase